LKERDVTAAEPLPGQAGSPPRRLELSDAEFARLQALAYRHFGIHLTEQKRSLVLGRLQKVIRREGYASFAAYCDELERDDSGRGLDELVNRLTTNHTFFYREAAHFEALANEILPERLEALARRGRKDIRIWCAGCSTGEEAYALQMTLMDVLGADYPAWDAGILATDISSRALGIAREGVYSDERVRKIPEHTAREHFRRRADGSWQVADRVRKEITFRRFNLMNERFPFKQPFDIIFCRNVMIYFDEETRDALVRRFYAHTAAGGYLFIGHSESLQRTSCPYRYIRPAVYRKEGA
jgi:chemotaxis protein methyltransferase CheR